MAERGGTGGRAHAVLTAAGPVSRRAGPEDSPAPARVINDWIDATPWMPRLHAPEEVEGILRAVYDAREIRGAGDPVEACLSFDPQRGQVGALCCRRTGAGVGTVLADRIRPGRSRLGLRTQVPNAGARRFHAHEGFTEGRQADPEPFGTVHEIEREWRG